jgi:hypothetical protein
MVILWPNIESGRDFVQSNLDGFGNHLTSKLDGFGDHLRSNLWWNLHLYSIIWPNIESSDEISNLVMKPHALCIRSHLHGVSKWKKNNIVGIGMVEMRRCTRFDLSHIRFYIMPKHVKLNLDAYIWSWMLRHHLRSNLRHLDLILDGDNTI